MALILQGPSAAQPFHLALRVPLPTTGEWLPAWERVPACTRRPLAFSRTRSIETLDRFDEYGDAYTLCKRCESAIKSARFDAQKAAQP